MYAKNVKRLNPTRWEDIRPDLMETARDRSLSWFTSGTPIVDYEPNHFLLDLIFRISRIEVEANSHRWADRIWRLIELCICPILLLFTLPSLLLIAIAIRFDSKGPVFYCQTRIGQYFRPIRVIKFRTMTIDAHLHSSNIMAGPDGRILKLGEDTRLTRVGRILRRMSLDELPQILNVILGDMSLIGPRPLLPEESVFIPDQFLDRFAVKPGISGLAQVMDRNLVDPAKKAEIDVQYVKNRGILFRFWIIFVTLKILYRLK